MRRQYEARADDGGPPPWFFDPFVPDVVTVTGSPHTADLHEVPWEDVPTEVLLAEQQCWLLRPGARWHGFERVTDGYAMTDPNKLTLVTPGFNRQTGEYLDWDVPAPVLAEFLRERGIVPSTIWKSSCTPVRWRPARSSPRRWTSSAAHGLTQRLHATDVAPADG